MRMDWVSIRMEHLFNHKGLNDICLHQPGLNETLLHQSKSFRIRKNIRIPCLSGSQRLHCSASHSDCRYMKHNRDSTNLILWLFDRLWQLKLMAKHSKTIRGSKFTQILLRKEFAIEVLSDSNFLGCKDPTNFSGFESSRFIIYVYLW